MDSNSTNPFRKSASTHFNESSDNNANKKPRNFKQRRGGGFSGNNNRNNHRNNQYKRNAEPQSPEDATPWAELKSQLKQQGSRQEGNKQNNYDNKAELLNQRELNHRKFLMENKRKEATVWEDFSGEEMKSQSSPVPSKSKEKKPTEMTEGQKHMLRQEITKSTAKSMNIKKNLKQAIQDLKRHQFVTKKK